METGGELVVIAAGSAMVKKGKDNLCKVPVEDLEEF
jgi:hypothetical protein